MASPSLPSTMRAIQLRAYDGKPESIRLVQVPVPRPGPGEVLIRVFASPLNPSDLLFLRGLYGFKKPLPAVPGFEGSGTVVEAGSGVMPHFLRGRNVACTTAAPHLLSGMWSEYAVTLAQLCVPLRKGVALEQAATLLINPLTALALIGEARRGRHRAVVQTAAASALGRMIVRLARRFSLPLINVVRRLDQVGRLRTMGAEHVLDSSAAGFPEALREMCHTLDATLGFDAVAGEMSGIVLRAQPPGSRLLIYGSLSLSAAQADPSSLIFEGKRLEGFYLRTWLLRKGFLARFKLASQAQNLLSVELKTEIQARLPLEEIARALKLAASQASAGKVLLVP